MFQNTWSSQSEKWRPSTALLISCCGHFTTLNIVEFNIALLACYSAVKSLQIRTSIVTIAKITSQKHRHVSTFSLMTKRIVIHKASFLWNETDGPYLRKVHFVILGKITSNVSTFIELYDDRTDGPQSSPPKNASVTDIWRLRLIAQRIWQETAQGLNNTFWTLLIVLCRSPLDGMALSFLNLISTLLVASAGSLRPAIWVFTCFPSRLSQFFEWVCSVSWYRHVVVYGEHE
jgi:hypothetical protein